MMETATTKIAEYGILGAVFLMSVLIAGKVIVLLYNGNEKKNEQLRKDFEEMRSIARGEALGAAEAGRKVIENNTKVLERVEMILTKILTDKI